MEFEADRVMRQARAAVFAGNLAAGDCANHPVNVRYR